MIIYGIKSKVTRTECITEPCPNCNKQNSVQISIWQKWAHIFWIPVLPMGKTGSSECTHCQQVLSLKKMPAILKMSYENVKLQTNTPVWTFSGIGVIIILVIVVNISEKQTAKKVTGMIPSLQKGDILQLKIKDNAYTLAKVNRVKDDTIFISLNKFQTDHSTSLHNLKDKTYETQEEALSVGDLKEMDKKEEILDIERD
jgi:preprotein translocase subunit YajC